MNAKEVSYLFVRYLFLVALAVIGNLSLIYIITTPLTIYSSYFILNGIYGATLLGNTINFDSSSIILIEACIAGAAYYLLLILNLSTPMKPNQRVKSLAFILISFFIINVLRIVIFAILLNEGFDYFDLAHKLVWYFGSTVMVVGLWFLNVYIFKIKSIPLYTDVNNFFDDIFYKKKSKSRK